MPVPMLSVFRCKRFNPILTTLLYSSLWGELPQRLSQPPCCGVPQTNTEHLSRIPFSPTLPFLQCACYSSAVTHCTTYRYKHTAQFHSLFSNVQIFSWMFQTYCSLEAQGLVQYFLQLFAIRYGMFCQFSAYYLMSVAGTNELLLLSNLLETLSL